MLPDLFPGNQFLDMIMTHDGFDRCPNLIPRLANLGCVQVTHWWDTQPQRLTTKKKKKKRNLGPCARSKIAVIIVAQSSLRLLPFVSGESWMGITWCFFGVFFFFFCILVSMWHEYQSYLCGRPRVQFPTIVFFIFCTILSRHFRLVVLKIYLFT